MRSLLKNALVFSAILFGVLFIYLTVFQKSYKSSELGMPAPQFETTNLRTGSPFKLKELIGKKIILINIWATWCGPCREEIPLLNQLNKSLSQEDFEIVAMMEDEAPSTEQLLKSLDRFNEKVPIDFAVYVDEAGHIADSYGTYMIPESYLIDWNGNIVHKHEGPLTKWDLRELETKIKTLLKK